MTDDGVNNAFQSKTLRSDNKAGDWIEHHIEHSEDTGVAGYFVGKEYVHGNQTKRFAYKIGIHRNAQNNRDFHIITIHEHHDIDSYLGFFYVDHLIYALSRPIYIPYGSVDNRGSKFTRPYIDYNRSDTITSHTGCFPHVFLEAAIR